MKVLDRQLSGVCLECRPLFGSGFFGGFIFSEGKQIIKALICIVADSLDVQA